MVESVIGRAVSAEGVKKEENKQVGDIKERSIFPIWSMGIELLEVQKDLLFDLERGYLMSLRNLYKGFLDFGIRAIELASNRVDDAFLFQKNYVELLKSIESRVLSKVLVVNRVNAKLAFDCLDTYLNCFKVFF
ncbi:MAG: hypothetical protein KatS3mg078_2200 [Deltaproteobacteria bacterium]|nr:MAG: hypothetical protein KatS3mg078_2200 [Deltaproteobacteria bacterium]